MFVDIHNHILPGIDDGAKNLDDALDMARLAVADGTSIMIATPHRYWGNRPDAPPSWVRNQVEALQVALNDSGIPLTVLPGTEIPISQRVAAELAAGDLLTLGDTGRCVLVEPPFDRVPDYAFGSIEAIIDAGFRVVLAHPERNAEIQRHLGFVEACADLGVVFQITTGSILGTFGRGARDTAMAIVAHAEEWEIVISSDAHDFAHRSPGHMAAARNEVAKLKGKEVAGEMVDGRPRRLLGL